MKMPISQLENPSALNFYFPEKVVPVLRAKTRYKVLRGGRGGGKSFAFADHIVVNAAVGCLRILCTREMQNSIRDSVHRLLVDRINTLNLDELFNITKEVISSKGGSEIIFRGLRHNISEIKSMEGIDICWVEEAEKVSEDSWMTLIPTIRKPDSEIWVSFNPEDESSPTYKRFVLSPPPDCASAEINYSDNPWFPEVLRKEMEYDKRVDYEKYEHVWLGKTKMYANALIFKGKFRVEEFETPADARFFYGADWGFANDPTAAARMFIKDRTLFIDYEAYGVGVEIEETPMLFDSIPEIRKWVITADSARPETISYMRHHGFNINGAEKGPGSVEDGIEFLRSFEAIIIHPRCKNSYKDFNNYKWKVDRITNEILPIPVDSSNHVPDACRYALEKYIKSNVPAIRWI